MDARAVKTSTYRMVFEILVIPNGLVFIGQEQFAGAQTALSAMHESDAFVGVLVWAAQITTHFVEQIVRNTEGDHRSASKWAMSVSIGRSPPGTRPEYANQLRSRILMLYPFQLR